MYLEEEDLVNHFLVHCRWAASVWHLALSVIGISWVKPLKVKDVLVAWRRRQKKNWVLGVWKIFPMAIWWTT